MAHLIDKDALVAEIERRISNHNKELRHANDEDFVSSWASAERNQKFALTELIPFINTFEVKEVDIEEEMKSWRHNHFNGKRDKEAVGEYLKRVSQLDLAKHFFELGLKTKQD